MFSGVGHRLPAGLDAPRQPLRGGALLEQREHAGMDSRAAEERRAAAEPVVAGPARVAVRHVHGVRTAATMTERTVPGAWMIALTG